MGGLELGGHRHEAKKAGEYLVARQRFSEDH
ncbi:predicted protein [Sclerotinia sclerotiorum 1980 UF-70]|uniref:Uncharacterized protein n=1 Tax=Sclerotinia sclerotiorum (strain ATCC 18683 / 1980 / Ss-1) TaxID=665079 RepID=A7E6J6_SCLS1|nr:predicted protein [Sclerotinia sclerotiorum 1980 UF-70]EDN91518.1 predicted protein [Sclerotinia sclerotiorum 1980 UF-70]